MEAVGQEYCECRAALMVRNNEGLTKAYNRFRDPHETAADIQKLRGPCARERWPTGCHPASPQT
jgi:hypothetical protein